ncbi:hypothetical protein G6R29_00805 [Fructobacillus sp. M2-14]|uniref:Uncharacterized protein n=1 Tax=Fructobacillus broussonetiae TaxID=2713173 RepID=A0ABS5QYE6_9LACO|nr:hypothetical protein [Fructobacillus broussonetiae]MBS9338175.1 hypothetical protein [Fructobacillus broussonetiae]
MVTKAGHVHAEEARHRNWRGEDLLEKGIDFDLQDVDKNEEKVLYLKGKEPKSETGIDDTNAVCLYDLTTGKEEILTKSVPNGEFTDAKFSPKEDKIALIGSDYEDFSATAYNLYLYETESQELTNITPSKDLEVGYGHTVDSNFNSGRSKVGGLWLTNDRYLFHSYHNGHSQLYIWSKSCTQLIDDQHRDVYDFAKANENELIIMVLTTEKPSELRRFTIQNGEDELLYNPNEDYEKSHDYAQVERFTLPSRDKKYELEGRLPKALTAKEKAPLILYIHGGAHDAYGDTFFHEFQALANEGYTTC